MKKRGIKTRRRHPAPWKWLLLAAWFFMGAAAPGSAAPDLSHFIDVTIAADESSGERTVRLYPDHQNPSTWYIAPARPRLKRRTDDSPDYGLALYRYIGRKGTSDSGDFWARGVLTVGIDRTREAGVTAKLRKALRSKGIATPRTRTMPVAGTRIALMFADQKKERIYDTRWPGGALVLALDAHESQILWDAAAAGQIQVSVAIEETLAGVRKKDGEWTADTTAATRVVPLEMDMNAHPGHFRRTDLGGRMTVGYTGLDVFCFDFLENLEENLYAKTVEVAIPTAGRDLVEALTFKAGDDYRRRIEFKLAKALDQPYRYRISRIYKDGRKQTGRWREKTGEAMLDITAYKNQTAESNTQEHPPKE